MPIGLTQIEMNSFAAQMLALLPSECVTYRTTTGDDIEAWSHWIEFTKHEMLLDPLLRNMRRVRIPSNGLDSPTRNAVLVRNAGLTTETTWSVDQVTGGPNRPYWFLVVRQVK